MQLALYWPLRLRQAYDCLDNNMLLNSKTPLHNAYAWSWTCTAHNHAFWSHPPVNCRDLTLCLSGLSWIYQSAEAKLSLPLSGNLKSPKRMRSLRNCATWGVISTTVGRSKEIIIKQIQMHDRQIHKSRHRELTISLTENHMSIKLFVASRLVKSDSTKKEKRRWSVQIE